MAPKFFSTARAPKTPFGIGTLIDQRYRLDAELGRGGMGIVYRARDIPNNRDVAVKIINVGEQNALAREQFLHEAQITAALDHPHIVAVYATGAVDTGARTPSPFIAMELIEGKSLSELRGLTYAQIIDLGQQICQALEYAHTQGLVHRDLKPQNVLVGKDGYRYVAKLVDFGLARQRGAPNLPTESGVAGTVYYLAPEVIAGQPADVAADLYALGVMLYEMVTGRVPFSNFDEQSILAQHLNESVVPPSNTRRDVPPALESIILRLLAKAPTDRFASARQVRLALERIAGAPERAAARSNLPPVANGFVGRKNEIEQVKRLLESNRMVTLLSDESAGKTQLAVAIGVGLTDQFADGVWLVSLASCGEPAAVPQIVATVLGVRGDARRALTVSLVEYLREKSALLILDHCDHLIGACAQLAETILRMCPAVRFLATSGQPLNIPGEAGYRVPPLALTRPDD